MSVAIFGMGKLDWTRGNLKGSLNWNTRPWDLILLRLGANAEIHSGNTKLQGVMGMAWVKVMLRI